MRIAAGSKLLLFITLSPFLSVSLSVCLVLSPGVFQAPRLRRQLFVTLIRELSAGGGRRCDVMSHLRADCPEIRRRPKCIPGDWMSRRRGNCTKARRPAGNTQPTASRARFGAFSVHLRRFRISYTKTAAQQ